MNGKTMMKFGGAALAVVLLVTAGVAMAHAGGRGARVGVSYDGDPSTGVLTNVHRNGTVLFEKVEYAPGDAKVDARGPGLNVRALNATTITLTLPANATIEIREAVEDWSPAGATITYEGGEKANLKVRNGTISVEGSVITLTLEADGGAHYGPTAVKGMFGFCPEKGEKGDDDGPRGAGRPGPRER